MTEVFEAGGRRQKVFASARASAAVTPDDSTDLAFDALYIGGAGDVAIKHFDNGAVSTFVGVPAGSILPVSGVRVMAATTATSILSLSW